MRQPALLPRFGELIAAGMPLTDASRVGRATRPSASLIGEDVSLWMAMSTGAVFWIVDGWAKSSGLAVAARRLTRAPSAEACWVGKTEGLREHDVSIAAESMARALEE